MLVASTLQLAAPAHPAATRKQRQHGIPKQRQHDTEDREENMIRPKNTVQIPKNTADAKKTARWQRQHDGKDSTMAKTARGKDSTMTKTVP